jgi:hypothetical protein
MNYKTPMTVAEAIERLKQLPQDAKLIHSSWDSEFMGTHYNHVYDFDDRGFVLTGFCKEDWYEDDVWDDEEEEEQE